MDHRIDITVKEWGRDAVNADRLLGALHEILPAAEAVIDQNVRTGELTASFVIAGREIVAAVSEATRVLGLASARAGLGAPHIVAVVAREGALLAV